MEEILHADLINALISADNDTAQNILAQQCSQVALDSALCWACRYDNIYMVQSLISKGAQVNAEVWGGFTPLIWAAMFSSNAEVLNILLSEGSYVDHASSKRRQTALHAAVIKGNNQFVNILLDAGADPDPQDYLYKTPLLYAIQRDIPSCVSSLIRHNCDVNMPGWVNGVSISPLVLALIQNNLQITKMLLLAGAKFEKPAIYQTFSIRQYYTTVEDDLGLEVRPFYLKQQCRVCIRHLLKPRFLEKLKQLMLPTSLREFLEISELQYNKL